VAPPLPWGLSDHHLGFPGTISLHPDTFYAVVRDVVTSLLGHSLRRYLLDHLLNTQDAWGILAGEDVRRGEERRGGPHDPAV